MTHTGEKNKAWLLPYEWILIEELNRGLCGDQPKQFGRSPDGYPKTMEMWESKRKEETSFLDAMEVCFRAHQLAPFLQFNGNTFVTIARAVVESLPIRGAEAIVVKDVVGHIVAGTVTDDERKRLRIVLETIGIVASSL